MVMKKVDIVFRASTAAEEASLVWYLLQEYSWFKSNGYNAHLPAHPEIRRLAKFSLEHDGLPKEYKPLVRKVIKEIYSGKDYEKQVRALEKSRDKISAILPKFSEFCEWGFNLHKKYEILLTLYGPGGSYDFTKGRIILLSRRLTKAGGSSSKTVNTIIHEMVHIGIEPIVRKFRLTHYEKERIVDLFCSKKLKIRGYYMQGLGDKRVDKFVVGNDFNLPSALKEYVKEHPRTSSRKIAV